MARPTQIYRTLPYREAILEVVLSSDIIGFQTFDFARHFLSTVASLLDANCSPQVRAIDVSLSTVLCNCSGDFFLCATPLMLLQTHYLPKGPDA